MTINTFQKVIAPLITLILQLFNVYFSESKDTQRYAKLNAYKTRQQQQTQDAVYRATGNIVHWYVKSSQSEKGAFNWLSTLPIAKHSLALQKKAFWGTLNRCCGWCIIFICCKNILVEHTLDWLSSIVQNELQDTTGQCLTDVCHGLHRAFSTTLVRLRSVRP